MIVTQTTESAAHKAASIAQITGTGLAAGSGGTLVLGLTPTEWSVIGIIGGLAVAVVGLIVKTWVDWHFQAEHLRLARARIAAQLPDGD